MYHANTIDDTPDYTWESGPFAYEELLWNDSWLQAQPEADSVILTSQTPPDLSTNIQHLSLAQFHNHEQELHGGLLFDNDYHQFGLHGHSNAIGELANAPNFESSLQTASSTASAYSSEISNGNSQPDHSLSDDALSPISEWSNDWRQFSFNAHASVYGESPTTPCPSETYTASSACRSLSIPLDHDIPSDLSSEPSSSRRTRISPIRHARTMEVSGYQSTCEDCDRSFTLRKDLERHKRSVHSRQRWPCPVTGCSRSTEGSGYRRKDALLLHMKKHGGLDEGDNTQTNVTLNMHSGARSGPQNYSPDKDTLRTTPIILMKQETPCSQSEPDAKSTATTATRTRTCNVRGCGKTFVNIHDLSRHRKTMHMEHAGGDGYRCAECPRPDRIWTRLDNFKKHLREQHHAENVNEMVERSKRVKRGVEAGLSFSLTTPEMFAQETTEDSNATR